MDDVLKKKINLLVHLAHADGHFHATEKKFLQKLLQDNGVKKFEMRKSSDMREIDVSSIYEKEELLYRALQLIKADGEVHPDEVAYCKALAIKLKFLPSLIDEYIKNDLPALELFMIEASGFRNK